MTDPALQPDDALLQASALAFAMLRFAEGAAHPSGDGSSRGEPRLGKDFYLFAPSSRRVTREEVPGFLASLPSPAALFPTTTRGVVALMLLGELSDDRAAAARHDLANQRAGLDDLAEQGGLTADSRILLELADESIVVTLAVLRVWTERFLVHVGWNIGPLDDDPRAAARLHLYRSDGVEAPPREPGFFAITTDVPIVHSTDSDMVLAAVRRHVPEILSAPSQETPFHVWLILDGTGRVERKAFSSDPPTSARGNLGEAMLAPFPGENMDRFDAVGTTMIPAGVAGPNRIGVMWLQRGAGVAPDPDNGVYQFDVETLLPARSTLEGQVKERYPSYARVGLTETDLYAARDPQAPHEPGPDEAIVPWFIADGEGAVVESWLGPMLQHSLVARQVIEARHPDLRFTSVRIGDIRTENGAETPVVWATLA